MKKEVCQFFDHYEKWEDYQNGMFETSVLFGKQDMVISAITLLRNPDNFYDVLKKVVVNWPIATKVNLTNLQQNRRAWLGAAACSYDAKVPEILTRIAWNCLDKNIQDEANAIAEKIINEFESQNNNAKTLFD